jgi:hypothetical protein
MKTLTLKISKKKDNNGLTYSLPVYAGHNFKDVFNSIAIGDGLEVVNTATGETVQSAVMCAVNRPSPCSDCIFRSGELLGIIDVCLYTPCNSMVPMAKEDILECL